MIDPVVIAPRGELDLHAVRALAPQLDDAAGADYSHLIVDLSAVTLVDSTALGAFIQLQHRFNGQGRSLSVIAPARQRRRGAARAHGRAVELLGVPFARRSDWRERAAPGAGRPSGGGDRA